MKLCFSFRRGKMQGFYVRRDKSEERFAQKYMGFTGRYKVFVELYRENAS